MSKISHKEPSKKSNVEVLSELMDDQENFESEMGFRSETSSTREREKLLTAASDLPLTKRIQFFTHSVFSEGGWKYLMRFISKESLFEMIDELVSNSNQDSLRILAARSPGSRVVNKQHLAALLHAAAVAILDVENTDLAKFKEELSALIRSVLEDPTDKALGEMMPSVVDLIDRHLSIYRIYELSTKSDDWASFCCCYIPEKIEAICTLDRLMREEVDPIAINNNKEYRERRKGDIRAFCVSSIVRHFLGEGYIERRSTGWGREFSARRCGKVKSTYATCLIEALTACGPEVLHVLFNGDYSSYRVKVFAIVVNTDKKIRNAFLHSNPSYSLLLRLSQVSLNYSNERYYFSNPQRRDKVSFFDYGAGLDLVIAMIQSFNAKCKVEAIVDGDAAVARVIRDALVFHYGCHAAEDWYFRGALKELGCYSEELQSQISSLVLNDCSDQFQQALLKELAFSKFMSPFSHSLLKSLVDKHRGYLINCINHSNYSVAAHAVDYLTDDEFFTNVSQFNESHFNHIQSIRWLKLFRFYPDVANSGSKLARFFNSRNLIRCRRIHLLSRAESMLDELPYSEEAEGPISKTKYEVKRDLLFILSRLYESASEGEYKNLLCYFRSYLYMLKKTPGRYAQAVAGFNSKMKRVLGELLKINGESYNLYWGNTIYGGGLMVDEVLRAEGLHPEMTQFNHLFIEFVAKNYPQRLKDLFSKKSSLTVLHHLIRNDSKLFARVLPVIRKHCPEVVLQKRNNLTLVHRVAHYKPDQLIQVLQCLPDDKVFDALTDAGGYPRGGSPVCLLLDAERPNQRVVKALLGRIKKLSEDQQQDILALEMSDGTVVSDHPLVTGERQSAAATPGLFRSEVAKILPEPTHNKESQDSGAGSLLKNASVVYYGSTTSTAPVSRGK